MRMKNKVLKVSIFTILFAGIIFGCHKEKFELEDDVPFDIISARNWYESNHSPEIQLKSANFSKGVVIGLPNWELAISVKNKDSKTIEIPLDLTSDFSFSTEESYRATKETGDQRFMKSRTTLIIEKKKMRRMAFS